MNSGVVYVHIIGGLGNQLFQYAAGRALARRYGLRLKLDTSDFHRYKLRPFLLPRYSLEYELVNRFEASLLRASKVRFGKLAWTLLDLRVIDEHQEAFQAIRIGSARRVYLRGYWQSEKYFEDCAEIIRRELVPRAAPNDENARMLNRIRGGASVCVHVRRGDYVANPSANAFHGLCGIEYYNAAAEHMTESLGRAVFFIFSDDIKWAKQNLKFPGETHFVSHNSADVPEEDLRLMAACRHHVIANSSLSWWGAWLAKTPEQIVVAPKIWFRGAAKQPEDLIPPGWIRL